jgi:hypothetical protein
MMMKTSAEKAASPPNAAVQPAGKPLAVSIAEFCRLTSIGRTKAYGLIRDGRLGVTRVDRRTLVLVSSIEALLNGFGVEASR